uniref:uS12 prolyl 3-hydroxylase n=1 Tax=Parastrongyloides trichosuri TaxID=131310 RepID=A0A0N4ZFX5_PARTI
MDTKLFKINDKYLNNQDKLNKDDKPFLVCVCDNFIEKEESLEELTNDLMKIKFSTKCNDLYSLYQTKDLGELSESQTTPIIKEFVNFMKTDVKEYLKNVTGFNLTDKVTLTGSRYQKGNYLLPHNDQISNRKVAFIIYLNKKDKDIEGGELNIYNVDEKDFPKDIILSEKPIFNRFNFFEVSNKSWHEVSEILSEDVERISINGWFHVEEDCNIQRHDMEENITEIIKEDFDLSLFLDTKMLDDKYMSVIKKRFEEDSYVALANFLRADILEKINEELKNVQFKEQGPWHKRRIMKFEEKDLPEDSTLKKFLICSRSDTFMKYFSFVTGLHFVDIPGAVTSYDGTEENDYEPGPSKKQKLETEEPKVEEEGIKMNHELYRLTKRTYICGDDQIAEKSDKSGWSLDVKFFFTDTKWSTTYDGYTSYIRPFCRSEILRLEPSNNVCFLVFKEPTCFDITKYVLSECGDNYMNCLNISYMGIKNDEEDGDFLDEEEIEDEMGLDEESPEEDEVISKSGNVHDDTDDEF